MSFLLLLLLFLVLLVIGVPIAVTLALMGVALALLNGNFHPVVLGHVMLQGLDSFSLLAVPFFMLAGGLMEEGGVGVHIMVFQSQTSSYMIRDAAGDGHIGQRDRKSVV